MERRDQGTKGDAHQQDGQWSKGKLGGGGPTWRPCVRMLLMANSTLHPYLDAVREAVVVGCDLGADEGQVSDEGGQHVAVLWGGAWREGT